jgi:hypothetical protein
MHGGAGSVHGQLHYRIVMEVMVKVVAMVLLALVATTLFTGPCLRLLAKGELRSRKLFKHGL